MLTRILLVLLLLFMYMSVCFAEVPASFQKEGVKWVPVKNVFTDAETYIKDDIKLDEHVTVTVLNVLKKPKAVIVDTITFNFDDETARYDNRTMYQLNKAGALEEVPRPKFLNKFNKYTSSDYRSIFYTQFKERFDKKFKSYYTDVEEKIGNEVQTLIKSKYAISNLTREHGLGNNLKQFDGIIVGGLTANDARHKAIDASYKEAIAYLGGEEMALQGYYRYIIHAQGGKYLGENGYDWYNQRRRTISDIFVKNYIKMLTPFAEAKGVKLIINDKFRDVDIDSSNIWTKSYLGEYYAKRNGVLDYEHERMQIYTDNDDVVIRYWKNISSDMYPWIMGRVKREAFKKAIELRGSYGKFSVLANVFGVEAQDQYRIDMDHKVDSITYSVTRVKRGIVPQNEIYEVNERLYRGNN